MRSIRDRSREKLNTRRSGIRPISHPGCRHLRQPDRLAIKRADSANSSRDTSLLRNSDQPKVKGVAEPVKVYEVDWPRGSSHASCSVRRGAALRNSSGASARMDADEGRRRASDGRSRSNRRGDGRGGHRQVAPVFSVQGQESQSGWMVLETFSVSHGKAAAYLPVLDLLQGYFKIADNQRTRREKVTGRVLALNQSWKTPCRTSSVLLVVANCPRILGTFSDCKGPE